MQTITKDTPVDYDDSKHLYTGAGVKYTSASQVVEKFVNPFNSKEVAVRYADKHGMTPEYWMSRWDTKNEKSKIRGNQIHDSNEIILRAKMVDKFQDRTLIVHADGIEDRDPWIMRPDGIYTERKLWHHGYKIAGRADKIILTTQHTDNNIHNSIRWAHIEDYKTNERLDFSSYRYSNGNYKMMKPPIGHIMDCNVQHYYLQLSLYMLMLEYQGFTPGTMTIKHYPHPTADEPNPQPVSYPVPYLKADVLRMITYLNR
jgi:hypothetical protein